MRTTIACFALALITSATTACIIDEDEDDGGDGDGSDTGSDTGSGSGSGSGSESVTPRAGRWFYAETTVVSTTCPANVDEGQASGDFAIAPAAGGFQVIPDDGTDPFTCTVTGAGFSCPDRAAATRDYRPGLDAVVTFHATAEGTFSSDILAIGRQEATVTCAGTQCFALAGTSLPCKFSVDFVVKAR